MHTKYPTLASAGLRTLALLAEVGRPPEVSLSLHVNRVSAFRAWLASPPVDPYAIAIASKPSLPREAVEVAAHQRCRGFYQRTQLCVIKALHFFKRIQPFDEEDFRFVDVADAADDALIEDRVAEWRIIQCSKSTQNFIDIQGG